MASSVSVGSAKIELCQELRRSGREGLSRPNLRAHILELQGSMTATMSVVTRALSQEDIYDMRASQIINTLAKHIVALSIPCNHVTM